MLAAELNEAIREENPHVYAMLSQLGLRLYFPKGVLSQTAEAKEKATRFDATIGIAWENRKPMFLPSVMKYLPALSAGEALTYAPALGQQSLRERWRDDLLKKNPSLVGKSMGMPIVTGGVTHALCLVGDLFIDKGDMVLLPDKFWENYELLFGVRMQAQIALFPFYNAEGCFNIDALRQVLETRVTSAKTVLLLNFPNNPTGYSIRKEEAEKVVRMLCEAADNGCNLLVITDDAYFGLYYDEECLQESLFAHLAECHERILAAKVDGPTKEEYVWGFRTGMLTFSAKANRNDAALYGALEKKVAGAIRSSISNCSQPAQSILTRAMAEESLDAERDEKKAILAARAAKVREILRDPAYADLWEPYPFNAGYFMCLHLKELDAEKYRQHLLNKYGVGVITVAPHDVRVAFSAVDVDDLDELFALMAAAARDLKFGEQ